MLPYILNAITIRHNEETAERTLLHFSDTRDLINADLIKKHIANQPLLAFSFFSLLLCSFGLVVFTLVFITCRLRGQCGAQKYQEYPSNSTNYAVYITLFFISWTIVMSAAAYFVLAGAGFWSEKFDAEQPLLRRSRSTITELFANYDYHGDFENVTETVTPKRELIRVNIRNPNFQKIPSPIEIPMRPLAEIIFNDSPDHDHDSSKHQPTRNEKSEEEQLSESKEDRSEATQHPTKEDKEYSSETLVSSEQNDYETTLVITTSTIPTTTTGRAATRTTEKVSNRPTTTTMLYPQKNSWTTSIADSEVDELDQLVTASTTITPSTSNSVYPSNLTFRSLNSRFFVLICRLTLGFVAVLLVFVILPTFFLVVAGTGCYIQSDHPMNRSDISNKIGKAVSINASILLFVSPCLLMFSSFILLYAHCHDFICAATIQMTQHQKSNSTNICSKSLAPVQALFLSSLLLCISLLPCIFSMFKLVKYYFRMSSEFYWNAVDNYAGRQFSKQQEFLYQGAVVYPDKEIQAGYAVYGQI